MMSSISRRGGRGAGLSKLVGAALLLLLGAPLSANAADTVHLFLSVAGTEITGESTRPGREGSIECNSAAATGFTLVDEATGAARGRSHRPFTIMKRIDQTTPLLYQAWATGAAIDFAEFRYYRQNRDTGADEHYYTVRLEGGFVSSINSVSPDTLDPELATRPATEAVAFVFQTITWTYEPTGASHQDSWTGSR